MKAKPLGVVVKGWAPFRQPIIDLWVRIRVMGWE